MSYARDFPTFRPTVRGAKESFDWNFVVVADNEVVGDVERRQRVAEGGVDRIYFFSKIGRFVHRLAVGVSGGQFEPSAGVAQAEFESVVIRFADGRLIGVAAEVRTQGAAGSVDHLAGSGREYVAFPEGTAGGGAGRDGAGLAQTQAERRVTGIGFNHDQKAVRLRAHVARAEHSVGSELPLDRQRVLLDVGNAIRRGVS